MAGVVQNSRVLVDDTGGVGPINPIPVSTKTPLTASAPLAVVVGVISTLILPANSARQGVRIVNLSTVNISLAFGTPAILDSGMTITPAGVFNMDEYDFNLEDIFAIASSANSNVGVQEFT